MSPEDPRLTESLRERAGSFSPRPAELGEIMARARAIRRRRRTNAMAGVAAAVVLVAVPTAVVLRPDNSATPPVAPTPIASTAPPSSTPSPSAPPVSPSTLPDQGSALRALKVGVAPSVAYTHGNTVVSPGGSTQQLPDLHGSLQQITAYHGGYLVAVPHNSGGAMSGLVSDVTLLDNTMKPQWTRCGTGFALSGDLMQTVYFTLDACTASATGAFKVGLASGMSDGEQSYALKPGQLGAPVGLVKEDVVFNRFSSAGVPTGVYRLGTGIAETRIPGLSSAVGISPRDGRIAGQSAADPTVGEVVDQVTGAARWHKKDWQLISFSPSGADVLAARSAGGEPSIYAILDAATGRLVRTIDLDTLGLTASAFTWESDDAVLAAAYDQSRQAIVRFGIDGSVERVTPLAAKGSVELGFVLGQ